MNIHNSDHKQNQVHSILVEILLQIWRKHMLGTCHMTCHAVYEMSVEDLNFSSLVFLDQWEGIPPCLRLLWLAESDHWGFEFWTLPEDVGICSGFLVAYVLRASRHLDPSFGPFQLWFGTSAFWIGGNDLVLIGSCRIKSSGGCLNIFLLNFTIMYQVD